MTDDRLIRKMQISDLDMVLFWRNQPDVRRYMLTQHEISLEEHREWFAKNTENSSRSLLIIEENGVALGFVQFNKLGSGVVADWGFYTSPSAPKGTGYKIGITSLNYAFITLKLHKVCGQALAFNLKSIQLHQKLGFHKEGVLRQQHHLNGAYQDLICFGLLRKEWNI